MGIFEILLRRMKRIVTGFHATLRIANGEKIQHFILQGGQKKVLIDI